MAIHNADVARVFDEIADLLEIANENPFRIRAYRNAARVVSGLGTEIADYIAAGHDPDDLPGIGADLAAKIGEIVRTGRCAMIEALRRKQPAGLVDLLALPGLGPKRVSRLHEALGVHDLPSLERACKAGRVRELAGFGGKTEEAILQALAARASRSRRFLVSEAAVRVQDVVHDLSGVKGVAQIVPAGSFRRMRDTVGDIDLVAVARDPAAVVDRLARLPDVADVLSRGTGRASVVLRTGLQVDVRFTAPDASGAALLYFTGSKAHNIALRRIAQDRGLKLNEYGLFRGERRIAGRSEAEVYGALGLAWIPPELREDAGEIDAAREGRLPDLVKLTDLRGDLHAHTVASDGRATIADMAAAARALGWEYVAVTDHSKRLAMARGLDAARLAEQIDEIGRFNARRPGIRVLAGTEVDILDDGSLDLPHDILARCDVVVGAIHSKLDASAARQTTRIVKAIESGMIHILAHPSGRLIGEREPMQLDMPRIVAAARKHGVHLELNAQPDRLDLVPEHCRMAKAAGVLVSIGSDAHSPGDLANMRYAIGQARRGWLEARDVLDTRPLGPLTSILASRGRTSTRRAA